jgi:hypothetical protein
MVGVISALLSQGRLQANPIATSQPTQPIRKLQKETLIASLPWNGALHLFNHAG